MRAGSVWREAVIAFMSAETEFPCDPLCLHAKHARTMSCVCADHGRVLVCECGALGCILLDCLIGAQIIISKPVLTFLSHSEKLRKHMQAVEKSLARPDPIPNTPEHAEVSPPYTISCHLPRQSIIRTYVHLCRTFSRHLSCPSAPARVCARVRKHEYMQEDQ